MPKELHWPDVRDDVQSSQRPDGDALQKTRFSEPKPFVYEVSQSLAVKKLCVTDKKSMLLAEQILRSTFRITIKELREFYEKHEIFALWYKDRMTSATIVSTHPTISMVNVVFFATMGYLSNLHFGTVLDNFIKYYAIQRGCNTVLVTALDMSMDFWRKQGYQEFQVTEEFTRAYIAAGAVQLRNTVFLSFKPETTAVTLALKQSAIDADQYLLERAEKSARSTIALRVLARHGTGSPRHGRQRGAASSRTKVPPASPAPTPASSSPMPQPPPSERSESELGSVPHSNAQDQGDRPRKNSPKPKARPGLPATPMSQPPSKAQSMLDAWDQREERHRRRDQLRDYRQQLWRQYLQRMAAAKDGGAQTPAGASSSPTPKRHKPSAQSQPAAKRHPRARRSRRAAADGNESSGSGDDTYTVDEVLQMKEEDGCKYFLVKWAGYAAEDSTWEPMENILDDALLQPFLKEQKGPSSCNGMLLDPNKSSSSAMSFPNDPACIPASPEPPLPVAVNIPDDAAGYSRSPSPPPGTAPGAPNHCNPTVKIMLPPEALNASSDIKPLPPKPAPKVSIPGAPYSTRVLRSAELKARHALRG